MSQTNDSALGLVRGAALNGAVKPAVLRQPGVWVVALLVAIVHAATAGGYDAHRNELYFLACGWHPDFGYVD